MRSVGIDIGSALAAVGVVVDGTPKSSFVWMPTKNISNPQKLLDWEKWLLFKLATLKPDIVAVEETNHSGPRTNFVALRQLSRYEGVALLAAKKRCSVVINPSVRTARKYVYHNGGISKDDAWKQVKEIFPGIEFRRKTVGGLDQMDALTHAMAAPRILEEGK